MTSGDDVAAGGRRAIYKRFFMPSQAASSPEPASRSASRSAAELMQ